MAKAFTKSTLIMSLRSFTTMLNPRTILGTMTIGGVTNQEDEMRILLGFCNSKFKNIVLQDPMLDSAIMCQGGKTEIILGNVKGKIRSIFHLNFP